MKMPAITKKEGLLGGSVAQWIAHWTSKKEGLLSFFSQMRQETASCIFLAAVAADSLVFIKHNFCNMVY